MSRYKLLRSLGRIDNMVEINVILAFIQQYNISAEQITACPDCLSLTKSLQLTLLQQYFLISNHKLTTILKNLLTSLWHFEQLQQLIVDAMKNRTTAKQQKDLIQVLYLLEQYQIADDDYPTIQEILCKFDGQDCLREVNKIVIRHHFPKKQIIKNSQQMVAELLSENTNSDLVKRVVADGLLDALTTINDANFLVNQFWSRPIAQWQHAGILAWARSVRNIPNYFNDFNNLIIAVAIAKRANFLVTGFELTHTQIMSCLMALRYDEHQRGRLLQVSMGSGKTIIISTLAVVKALQGHSVDIITSSPVHAEEGARSQAPFYQLFGLTVADNLDRTVYTKGVKPCYQCDIVYGEASQFQFDTLRQEYSALKTKADRPLSFVILDEVDSMLIDDSSRIAKLASTVAGMDQLQPIYLLLFQRINEMHKRVLEIDGKLHFLNGLLSHENDKIILHYQDKLGDIQRIADLKNYLTQMQDISHLGQVIEEDIAVFLEKNLTAYLNELIKNSVLNLPIHLQEFVDTQKSKWIQNAFLGFTVFQEYVNYIVQEGLVKPVAFNSNGTVQNATNWSDGLHQFLQIKHGLRLTSETLTTNFLSNVTYFKRYGANLLGLTGTLGSATAQQIMADVYQVDLVNIPDVKVKQYQSLPTILADSKEEWVAEICFEVNYEKNKGRGSLLICRTIEDVLLLESELRANNKHAVIKTYILNGENQEKAIAKILPGEIIIATNLAGRGTDINADEIDSFGGMAVIVTYMPDNLRVEKQALFRTARQGNLGTGRKIINKQDLREHELQQLVDLDKARDELEAQQLEQFRYHELVVIETKDSLFQSFCGLMAEIRVDIRSQSQGIVRDVTNAAQSILSTDVTPSFYETIIIAAIEEQWAFFLRKIDDGRITLVNARQEYERFAKQIFEDYQNGDIIKNPYHHIALANDLLANESFFENASEKALRHYEAAIALDEKSSAAAFIGKAWILIKNKAPADYKQIAIAAFSKARELLIEEMSSLQMMQGLLQEQGVNTDSDLIKQLMFKANLLGSSLNSITAAINSIKKSQRLITLEEYDHRENNETGLHVCYPEVLRNQDGTISKTLLNGKRYRVQFNDLTAWHDSGNVDQALNTLAEVFKDEQGVSLKHQSFGCTILLSEVDLAAIQTLFSSDLIFDNLDRQTALKKLEEGKSFLNRLSAGLLANSQVEMILVNSKGVSREHKLSLSDAKKMLQTIQDSDRVTLKFSGENKAASHVSVEFTQLTPQDLLEKLPQITCATVDLELTASRTNLLSLLERQPNLTTIQCYKIKPDHIEIETLDRKTAIALLTTTKDQTLTFKLSGLTHEKIRAICQDSAEIEISATLHELNVKQSQAALQSGSATVQFSQLAHKAAEGLITQLRSHGQEFAVCFDNLSANQAEQIISKADLRQEEIEITTVKSLSELPIVQDSQDPEWAAFAARGLEYLIELHETGFIPWWSVCALGLISTVQMGMGVALVSTGFGANVGMGLITEGAADLVSAYRVYSTRQFTWEGYCQQKAVSLAISAVSLGWQSLKNAGRGVNNLMTGVGQEALEQAGTHAIMNGKTLGQRLLQESRNLRVLAFQQVGVSVAEAGAREGLNQLVNKFSHFQFARYQSEIQRAIRSNVDMCFCESALSRLVKKMLALDQMRQTSVFNSKIELIIRETLDPKHTYWQQQWQAIGWPLCQGLLSSSEHLRTPISAFTRIAGIVNGITEIHGVVTKVHEQLYLSLAKFDRELTITLLQQDCKLSQATAMAINQLLIDNTIFNEDASVNLKKLAEIDFAEHSEHKNTIINYFQTLQRCSAQVDTHPIAASMSQVITEHVMRVTEMQLISPITSAAVAGVTNSLSQRIQDFIIRSQLTAEIHERVDEYDALVAQHDPQATHNRREELVDEIQERQADLAATDGHITVATRIGSTATRYTNIRSQCEIGFFAQQPSSSSASTSQQQVANAYAADVENGDEPAKLYEMTAMDSVYGTKLKIVDDPYYEPTPEDKLSNRPIVVFIKGEKDQDNISGIGHWMLMNSNGELIDLVSQDNDCGYAIFSHLTGKSIAELRAATATQIIEQADNFYHAMLAQQWIEDHNPMDANDLLFNGGKKKDKEQNKEEELRLLDLHDPSFALCEDAFNTSQAVYKVDMKNAGNLERIGNLMRNEKYNINVGMYRNKNTGNIYIAFEGIEGLFDKSGVDASKIAMLGTDPFSRDWTGQRMKEFIHYANINYPDSKILLVGHSRGGLLATFHAINTGLPAIVFDSPGYVVADPNHNVPHFTPFKPHEDASNVVNIQGLRNVVNSLNENYNLSTIRTGMGHKTLVKGHTVQLLDCNAKTFKRIRRNVTGNVTIKHHKMNNMGELISKYEKNREHIKRAIEKLHFPEFRTDIMTPKI